MDIMILTNLFHSALSSYTDMFSDDGLLLMEGGSNTREVMSTNISNSDSPAGPSSGGPAGPSSGGPAGPSNGGPGGSEPENNGANVESADSPRVKKRKHMAEALQSLMDRELESRGNPKYVNNKVFMSDLNIVNFRSTNLTLPSVDQNLERAILEYRIDHPEIFNKHPGKTLVSKLISHLINNKS